MERKQGKQEELPDRSDAKPGEHSDGQRASRLLRQAWVGGYSRARKLRLDALAVEENKPPNTNQKGNAVSHEQNPTNRLHALRRQSRRTRTWRKLREKCNGDPDDGEKDRKATPNQDGNARPVAKIKESNAGGDTEEGQTDHKALSGKPEGSYRRRKFRGSAGQLDKQQR